MAVRKAEDQEAQAQAPAPVVSGNGFFSQVIVICVVMAFGFGANSFLTTAHENEQVKTEYRGYRDAIKDVR